MLCFIACCIGQVNMQQPSVVLVHEIAHPWATTVAWRPDGTQLAVGDHKGIQLYTAGLEPLQFLEQPSEMMKELQWSPDGQYLAAYGTNDVGLFNPNEPRQTNIEVWDVSSSSIIRHFDEHESYVVDLVWSGDSQQIASASWDRSIRVWNVFSKEVVSKIEMADFSQFFSNRNPAVVNMDWSEDGEILAELSAEGVFVWTQSDSVPQRLTAFDGQSAGILAWNPASTDCNYPARVS
jgi:WD40 repeat protein